MAIQRTKPGQSFLNRPIGVVSKRTGAERVYEARARQAEQVGKFAFEYAVSAQQKAGEEYALNEVKVRGEDNRISYQKMPRSLGKYGQAAAEKIFDASYLNAANVDLTRTLTKFHQLYKNDPAAFENASVEYLKQTALQMEQEGADKLAKLWFDNAYGQTIEHVNKISLQKFEVEETLALSDYLEVWSHDVSDMSKMLEAGRFDEGQLAYTDIRAGLRNQVEAGRMDRRLYIDSLNKVNDAFLLNKTKYQTRDFTSDQLNRFMELVLSGDFEEVDKVLPGFSEDFKTLAPTIDRQNKFRASISYITQRRKSVEDQVRGQTEASTWMASGAFGTGSKERKYAGAIMGVQTAEDYSNINFKDMTPEEAQAFRNLPLPDVAYTALEDIAAGDKIGANPQFVAKFVANIQYQRKERLQDRPMGLTVEQRMFLDIYDDVAKQVDDPALAYTKTLEMMVINPEESDRFGRLLGVEASQVDTPSKLRATAVEILEDELGNSGAAREYANAFIVTMNTRGKSRAIESIKNNFSEDYQFYSAYENIDRGFGAVYFNANRGKYTPKYYYGYGSQLLSFEKGVQAIVKSVTGRKTVKPGLDYYLRPDPNNDEKRGQWMLLDEDRKPITDVNNKPVIISTEGQLALTKIQQRKVLGMRGGEERDEQIAKLEAAAEGLRRRERE